MFSTKTEYKAKSKALAFGFLLAALLAAMLLTAQPAHATIFNVNSTGDGADANLNDNPNSCDTQSLPVGFEPECTLRAAIQEANATSGADEIVVPAGTYTLTLGGRDEHAAAGGDLDITDALTIQGAGAASTVVQAGTTAFGGIDRVFEVRSGASTTISGMTIRNGNPGAGADGGGVRNSSPLTLENVVVSGSTSVGGGGVVGSFTTLEIIDSAITGNRTTTFGVRNSGGGIFLNGATTTISGSTISGNEAEGGGGGMMIFNGPTVTVENSTISGNVARDAQSQFPGGGVPGGGGVNNGGGTLTLTNATVTGNKAASGAGLKNSSTLNAKNTIVADNQDLIGDPAANCAGTGTITSQGHNLDSGTSCGFTQARDLQNIKPKLDPLADNGGPTQTQALQPRSPAIDAGTNTGCPATDQRGVRRPQGLRCDIGAYERPNSAPVARNNAFGGVEDRILRVPARRSVLSNDTDPDGDALTARIVSRPKKGKLVLRPNGTFTYEPKKNFNGAVRFVYRASDGRGGTDNATVTIRIKARPK